MVTALTFPHDLLVMDSDCGISLWSSGHMADILRTIPVKVGIINYVRQYEMLYILGPADQNGYRSRLPMTLDPLYQANLLVDISMTTEEHDTAMNLAVLKLDNGEACAAAVAIHRNGGVASDDGPARRKLMQQGSTIQFLSTSQLVKWWVEQQSVPDDEVRAVLRAMQEGSRYGPSPNDELFPWWQTFM